MVLLFNMRSNDCEYILFSKLRESNPEEKFLKKLVTENAPYYYLFNIFKYDL